MNRGWGRGSFALAVVFVACFSAAADEPPGAELLPPPRQVFNPPVQFVPAPPPFPVGRDVWQLLAVDRSGRFRPRVAYTPYGSYYLYNHAPYPWTTTRPLEWRPLVVGPRPLVID